MVHCINEINYIKPKRSFQPCFKHSTVIFIYWSDKTRCNISDDYNVKNYFTNVVLLQTRLTILSNSPCSFFRAFRWWSLIHEIVIMIALKLPVFIILPVVSSILRTSMLILLKVVIRSHPLLVSPHFSIALHLFTFICRNKLSSAIIIMRPIYVLLVHKILVN